MMTEVMVGVVILLLILAGLAWWTPSCPTFIHRMDNGMYRLEPSGQVFADMQAFHTWWRSAHRMCPLPALRGEQRHEQPYATTPINKVDDYEFSRIFGYERGGRMEIPQQNFNLILNQRTFDWPDKPLTSDERQAKYVGLREGFTAGGELKAYVMGQPDAPDLVTGSMQQYGGKEADVKTMVQQIYQTDPDYEPILTKVGANHWEVNELRPRQRQGEVTDAVPDRVVDASNPATKVAFTYHDPEAAIDPYFTATGDLPYQSERLSKDPWYGPVPGMERMFGPTLDHVNWT
jgi:hypothetical protein